MRWIKSSQVRLSCMYHWWFKLSNIKTHKLQPCHGCVKQFTLSWSARFPAHWQLYQLPLTVSLSWFTLSRPWEKVQMISGPTDSEWKPSYYLFHDGNTGVECLQGLQGWGWTTSWHLLLHTVDTKSVGCLKTWCVFCTINHSLRRAGRVFGVRLTLVQLLL